MVNPKSTLDDNSTLVDNQEDNDAKGGFSARLKFAMEDLKFKQVDIARISRESASTISNYVRGEKLPSALALVAISKALGVRPAWLLLGEGPQTENDGDGQFPVPMLDLRVAGGAGAYRAGRLNVGQMSLDEELMRQIGRTSTDGLVVMLNSGDSNDPLIKDGAPILVDERDTRLREGPLFTFRLGDDLRVKKLRSVGLGDIEVSSVNPLYPPEIIHGEMREHFEIIGRVLLTWTRL